MIPKFTKIQMVSQIAPIGGSSLFFGIFPGEKLLQKAGITFPEKAKVSLPLKILR